MHENGELVAIEMAAHPALGGKTRRRCSPRPGQLVGDEVLPVFGRRRPRSTGGKTKKAKLRRPNPKSTAPLTVLSWEETNVEILKVELYNELVERINYLAAY